MNLLITLLLNLIFISQFRWLTAQNSRYGMNRLPLVPSTLIDNFFEDWRQNVHTPPRSSLIPSPYQLSVMVRPFGKEDMSDMNGDIRNRYSFRSNNGYGRVIPDSNRIKLFPWSPLPFPVPNNDIGNSIFPRFQSSARYPQNYYEPENLYPVKFTGVQTMKYIPVKAPTIYVPKTTYSFRKTTSPVPPIKAPVLPTHAPFVPIRAPVPPVIVPVSIAATTTVPTPLASSLVTTTPVSTTTLRRIPTKPSPRANTFAPPSIYTFVPLNTKPVPITTTHVPTTISHVPTYTTTVSTTTTPFPTTSTPVPTTITPFPTTITPVPTTTTPFPTTMTPVPTTTTTPIPRTITLVPTTITPVPITITADPTTITPVPSTTTPVLTTASPAPTTTLTVPTNTMPTSLITEPTSTVIGSTTTEVTEEEQPDELTVIITS